MKVFITGDTHADIDWSKLNSEHTKGVIGEGDIVIVLGDFAAVWDGGKQDRYIQKWYDSKPWTTLFIDGNHENHDLLNQYPVTELFGGRVHKISEKVYHLMRGEIFDIGGLTYFAMGGAQSHDMMYRKEGISWWRGEMPTDEEYNRAFDNLAKHNNCVDIILSHCAPDSVQDKLAYHYTHDKLTNFLEVVKQDVDFALWFCGHYHVDTCLEGGIVFLVYNKVIEVGGEDETDNS